MSEPRNRVLCLLCLFFLALLAASAQSVRPGPAVASVTHFDTSSPLRTMVLTPPRVNGVVPGEHAEFEGFSKPVKVQYYPDNVLQSSAGAGQGATLGLSFAGV